MAQIPQIWLDEIAAGTPFGLRAKAAIARMPASPRTTTPQAVRQPVVSTIGTQLRAAFETAMSHKITCSPCLSFLKSLDYNETHDREKIIRTLHAELNIPQTIRDQHTRESLAKWVDKVASTVLGESSKPVAKPESAQFVWTYWSGGAEGDEIRWSVRSVETFFIGTPTCVIVGDRPPWFTGHVIECPRVASSGDSTHYDATIGDLIHKMQTVVKSPEIAFEFVWNMDDIHFVKPVSLADLKTPRGTQWLPRRDSAWQRTKTATMQALTTVPGRKKYDYATHLPHVFEKEKLAAILRDYPGNLLFENLYGNLHREPPQPLEPFFRRIEKPRSAVAIRTICKSATIINNHNGAWCTALRDTLRDLMPNPSSVETDIAPPLTPVAVDVVIPFCEADAAFLVECLLSMDAQRFARLTVHVVADGCNFPSLPEFTGAISELRPYRTEGGWGPYQICNSIVASGHCLNPWLAIQDADDTSHPDRFWRQVQMMIDYNADMISSAMKNYVDAGSLGDTNLAKIARNRPVINPGAIYNGVPLGCCINSTRTMRRELFERLNGFPAWVCSADYAFDNMARYTGAVVIDDQTILGNRRLHSRSLTGGEYKYDSEKRKSMNAIQLAQLARLKKTPTLVQARDFGALDRADRLETRTTVFCSDIDSR